jgi:glutathione S-transferase
MDPDASVTGEGPTAEVVKHMSWDLNQRLEGYERLLSRQPYLAGEELTLADLFHMPNGLQVLQVRRWDYRSLTTADLYMALVVLA